MDRPAADHRRHHADATDAVDVHGSGVVVQHDQVGQAPGGEGSPGRLGVGRVGSAGRVGSQCLRGGQAFAGAEYLTVGGRAFDHRLDPPER